MATLLEDLRDLYKQAKTERSHHYVAETVLRAMTEIAAMRDRLADLEAEFAEMTRAFAELTASEK